MPLIPDRGKQFHAEQNVNIPGLDRPGAAYDLALFEELGNASRAVLLVSPVCRLTFKDGDGPNLAWTPAGRTNFTSALRTVLTDAWSEKHVLQTATPTALKYQTIGVVFDIVLSETLGASDHSHWNITVTKVPPGWVGSATYDPVLGGLLNGRVKLDSEDLTPENKGGPDKQRAAIHEFGHMLGYLDEYLDKDGKPEGIPHWTADQQSVMNLGEGIRPRHYVWFAEWCNRRHATFAALSKTPIEWKVNGSVNKATARIV